MKSSRGEEKIGLRNRGSENRAARSGCEIVPRNWAAKAGCEVVLLKAGCEIGLRRRVAKSR